MPLFTTNEGYFYKVLNGYSSGQPEIFKKKGKTHLEGWLIYNSTPYEHPGNYFTYL